MSSSAPSSAAPSSRCEAWAPRPRPLTRSDPADVSVLKTAPGQITLTFNEDVSLATVPCASCTRRVGESTLDRSAPPKVTRSRERSPSLSAVPPSPPRWRRSSAPRPQGHRRTVRADRGFLLPAVTAQLVHEGVPDSVSAVAPQRYASRRARALAPPWADTRVRSRTMPPDVGCEPSGRRPRPPGSPFGSGNRRGLRRSVLAEAVLGAVVLALTTLRHGGGPGVRVGRRRHRGARTPSHAHATGPGDRPAGREARRPRRLLVRRPHAASLPRHLDRACHRAPHRHRPGHGQQEHDHQAAAPETRQPRISSATGRSVASTATTRRHPGRAVPRRSLR
ncbi:copper resistance protein CopC [Streptomyces sp. NPDC058534]|uniref:copper resistance protein CopC n=1 Tax=Streptomyces sp. NPDC058534 TaxID=3346541 RepID=UPI0036656A73